MAVAYTIVRIQLADPNFVDILIAELSDRGYDSFEETTAGLDAYIETDAFDKTPLESLLDQYRTQTDIQLLSIDQLEQQNWNALWESNFQPVFIGKDIVIKAPFHQIDEPFPHTIVIEPKMAFGTGHHETTAMMLQGMLSIDLHQKSVLDFGCGTGILAIFAAQNNAQPIIAIDYDPLSTENTLENCRVNNINNITVILGDKEAIPKQQQFDIVLANITRNVITDAFDQLYHAIANHGTILFSGILLQDIPDLITLAQQYNLQTKQQYTQNNWAMIQFTKPPQ